MIEEQNDDEDIKDENDDNWGYCYYCGEETTVHKCFQTFERMDNGSYIHFKICDECCYEYFFEENNLLEDGCTGDCDFTEKAVNIMKNELDKIAISKKLEKFEKFSNCYTNRENSFLIGISDYEHSFLNNEFEDKKLEKINKLYIGNKYLLVKYKKKILSFNNLDFIYDLFRTMKENPEYLIYKLYNKRILYVRGSFVWIMCIDYPDVENALYFEKKHFNNKIYSGKDFFHFEILMQLNFDFSKMSPNDFEELCKEILNEMKTFSKVERIGGTSGDSGTDLIAIERIKTFEGESDIFWLVQCKKYEKNVTTSEIHKIIINLIGRDDIDGILIMTSSDISSPMKKIICSHGRIKNKKIDIKIKFFNKYDLINYLFKSPTLINKYSNLIY